MASKLRLVKNMADTSVTMLKLLSSFVLGDEEIKPYDPAHVYKKYDKIVNVTEDGHITILMCQEDDVTGTYDGTKWKVITVQDSITGEISEGGNGTIEVSEIRPYATNNKTWWHVKNTVTGYDPQPDPVAVYKGNQIIAQEEQPTDDNIIVWLDIEP